MQQGRDHKQTEGQHDVLQETTTESDTHTKGTVTLDDIPSELIAMTLEMVDDVDVVVCQLVNKQWNHLLVSTQTERAKERGLLFSTRVVGLFGAVEMGPHQRLSLG